jgi:nucleoside 2-deoxyribosyltransferase
MAVCPLCEDDIAKETYSREDRSREIMSYNCPTCGIFSMTREVWDDYLRLQDYSPIKYKISSFTRERTIHEQQKIIIVSPGEVVGDSETPMIDFQTICDLFPNKFSDRIDRALLNMAKLSNYAGAQFNINRSDYSLIFADGKDDPAYFFILKEIIRKGFIDGVAVANSPHIITPDGWDRIYYLETEKNPFSNQGFVAMWFDESMDNIWTNGFRKAIVDAGFEPSKIDIKEFNNLVNDEIIAEIRRSKFVVSDFTGQRGGVYFEAGFAMGLNKPVIFTCRSDQLHDCHFDTNHYNHIVWDNEDDLCKKLFNRIRATIV